MDSQSRINAELSSDERKLLADFRSCNQNYREHVLCFTHTAATHSLPQPTASIITLPVLSIIRRRDG